MVTIRVKENSKQAKLMIEMLKTFDFVEFIDKDLNFPSSKNKNSKLMQDIEIGLNQLKQKKEGKLKFKELILNGK